MISIIIPIYNKGQHLRKCLESVRKQSFTDFECIMIDNNSTDNSTELYKKYEKEVEAGFSDDLKNELNRAGRIKLSSITGLDMPLLIISGVDEVPTVTHGSLLNGFTEKDMIVHSIENRSLLSIKNSAVQFFWIQGYGAHYKLQRIAGTNIINILNQQLVYDRY